ncbi:MAG: hypothetical protein R3F59_33465 [Myxococcota bacterium]
MDELRPALLPDEEDTPTGLVPVRWGVPNALVTVLVTVLMLFTGWVLT